MHTKKNPLSQRKPALMTVGQREGLSTKYLGINSHIWRNTFARKSAKNGRRACKDFGVILDLLPIPFHKADSLRRWFQEVCA